MSLYVNEDDQHIVDEAKVKGLNFSRILVEALRKELNDPVVDARPFVVKRLSALVKHPEFSQMRVGFERLCENNKEGALVFFRDSIRALRRGGCALSGLDAFQIREFMQQYKVELDKIPVHESFFVNPYSKDRLSSCPRCGTETDNVDLDFGEETTMPFLVSINGEKMCSNCSDKLVSNVVKVNKDRLDEAWSKVLKSFCGV